MTKPPLRSSASPKTGRGPWPAPRAAWSRPTKILSQIAQHAAYGGVVPEIAARAHVEVIDRLVARALAKAGIALADVDGIAAAAGPGLIGGVIVGLTSAKALALVSGKPFIAINHLEAHALTARLTDGIAFPYLLLLASGGHTQLIAVRGVGDYVKIGGTIDDAIGEAFDKVAKLLGLPYPGGPHVEEAARRGDPQRFHLPRPMLGTSAPGFLAFGPQDRPARRGRAHRAALRAGCVRSLRLLPGGGDRYGGRSHPDRPCAISRTWRRAPPPSSRRAGVAANQDHAARLAASGDGSRPQNSSHRRWNCAAIMAP